MLYFITLTLPPNTLQNTAIFTTLSTEYGVIESMEIEFPSGCVGLVYGRVTYNTFIILPFNPGGWIRGDNRTYKSNMDYLMNDPPYDLLLHGYNLDDTYAHTISIAVNVKPGYRAVDINQLMGVS